MCRTCRWWLHRLHRLVESQTKGWCHLRTMQRAEWDKLPSDLLNTIFQSEILQTRDLLRAELCCRSWHSHLTQAHAWRLPAFDPHNLPYAHEEPSRGRLEFFESFTPFCRWLQHHATAMQSMRLATPWCPDCHEEASGCCDAHSDDSERVDNAAAFVMLMAALQGTALEITIDLDRDRGVWPTNRAPEAYTRLMQVYRF
ncbi:hypothetical protein WJX73_002922 [Symbiochloris irregularis]|uniref:F-box domain-containing protein n=1 Tax=Symbiochloris irregularis TaxID=706552 RepID=A0AAW1PEY0_9CHLO